MTDDDWNRYHPRSVAGYRLGETVSMFPDRAIFRASLESANAGEVDARFVWLFDTDEDTVENRVNRYLEATFFDHPNLLRVYAAGQMKESGTWFVYAISEAFDYTLGGAEPPRPLNFSALRPLLLPVCGALAWLHSQDLVYCALRGDSVVRAGGEWKLADFSELRVAGRAPAEETRRLMIRRDLYAPPEAYEGVVLPGWDAWSLGLVIQSIYAREARAVGRNPRTIPAQAGELIRELGDTDPAQRLSIEALADRLEKTGAASGPVPPPAIAEPATPEALELLEPPHAGGQRLRILAVVALVCAALVILAVIHGNQPRAAQEVIATAPSGTAEAPATLPPKPAAPNEVPAPTDRTDSAAEKRAITALLDRWVSSTRKRDASAQAACYAPVVQEFFGRRDITVDQVKRAKERAFEEVGPAREFSIRDMRFDDLAPGRAVISFLKSWDFPERHFAGSTREEMVIRQIGDAWKISSERELNQSALREDAGRSALTGPVTNDSDSTLSERGSYGVAGNR